MKPRQESVYTTTVFSVVNAVLLRPLPYPQPERIARLSRLRQTTQGSSVVRVSLTAEQFELWRGQTTTLSHVALHAFQAVTVTGRREPLRLNGTRVSPAFFDVMGVRPLLGRRFLAEEERPGSDDVIILSQPEEGQTQVELTSLQDEAVRGTRPALRVLFAAVWLVLLVSCANVANLLLARATSRQADAAVRLALGAGRGAVGQAMAESLILAVAGGAAAWVLTFWGVRLLRALQPGTIARLEEVDLDGRVLLFTAGVILATGAITATLAAFQVWRIEPRSILNERAASGSSGTGPRRGRLTRVIAVAQVALATMLLCGAGLLITTRS